MSLKSEVIRKIDKTIVDQVAADELLERFKACYQCGTCSGGCPSGRRTSMRTREIIRDALIGLSDELLKSDLLWLCSTCYTCYERCPRDVPTTDIIIKLRNIASQHGFMKGPHIAVSKMLIETGHGVPINDEKWNNLRASLNLSPVPPTVHAFPEALKEVQTIIKELKFDELIAYGEAVKKEMENKEKAVANTISSSDAQKENIKQEAGQ
ncbi:MAG: CoB--CoM heterodisulfide reductase subunit C [Promethearchaeota archaeon]